MSKAIVVMLMLVTAAPAFADQPAPNPQSKALLGALRKVEQANPYSKLFEAQQALKQAVADQLKQAVADKTGDAKPKVVCGMIIIPVGPEIDPKMAVGPPEDPKVTYTIRAIDPPICNSSRR